MSKTSTAIKTFVEVSIYFSMRNKSFKESISLVKINLLRKVFLTEKYSNYGNYGDFQYNQNHKYTPFL